MGLLRRIAGHVRRTAGTPGLPHVDTELESRLPGAINGIDLDRMSHGLDGLDQYGQYWFGVLIESLELGQDAFTVAYAGRVDDERAVRAARFRGARPRDLQRMLDQDAWTDRRIAGGDETVSLGGVRVRRGVAGERSFTVGPDGTLVARADEPEDPAGVYHQLVRGDTWLDIFGRGDDRWTSEVAALLADGARIPGGDVRLDLPDGWLTSTLPGGADPGLAARIGDLLADHEPAVRERWDGVLARLVPVDYERTFVTGTRLVAYNLEPAAIDRGPSGLEIWEHLAPYESPEEELEAERREATQAGARSVVARMEAHPTGRAVRVAAAYEEDDVRLLVDRWLLRTGPLAYDLLCFAASPGSADRTTFEAIARSFVPPTVTAAVLGATG